MVGWLAGWADPGIERCSMKWLVGWLVGWLDGWLRGWAVEWLGGWVIGWLDGWLVGWVGGASSAYPRTLGPLTCSAYSVSAMSSPARKAPRARDRPAIWVRKLQHRGEGLAG